MDKTKVVTFRIEEDALKAIDQVAKNHTYYRRSNVIMASINLMLELEKKGLAGRALSFHPKLDEVTKLEFEIRRKIRS